jgi:hypothetical protein
MTTPTCTAASWLSLEEGGSVVAVQLVGSTMTATVADERGDLFSRRGWRRGPGFPWRTAGSWVWFKTAGRLTYDRRDRRRQKPAFCPRWPLTPARRTVPARRPAVGCPSRPTQKLLMVCASVRSFRCAAIRSIWHQPIPSSKCRARPGSAGPSPGSTGKLDKRPCQKSWPRPERRGLHGGIGSAGRSSRKSRLVEHALSTPSCDRARPWSELDGEGRTREAGSFSELPRGRPSTPTLAWCRPLGL